MEPEIEMPAPSKDTDEEPKTPPPQPLHKKRNFLIIIAVSLLIVAGIAGFVVFGGSDSAEEEQANNQTNTDTSPEAPEVVEVLDDFADIVYLHGTTNNGDRQLFYRPAAGGEREPLDFEASNTVYPATNYGGEYFFIDEGSLYYGTDKETPKLLTTFEYEEINSVTYDPASRTVAVATDNLFYTDAGSAATRVTIVDVDTTNTTEFIKDQGENVQGFYVQHWDGTKNELYAIRLKLATEDPNNTIIKYDDQGNATEIFKTENEFNQTHYDFNTDGTKALYVVAKNDYTDAELAKYPQISGFAEPTGAPFELYELDVASGTSSRIAVIGEIEDNKQGSLNWPLYTWAAFEDGERPVYSYMTKLFVQDAQGGYSNYFEADNDITTIYAVDADEVLVGAAISGGERLSYYNIEKKKGAIVMETTYNTSILTVTRK